MKGGPGKNTQGDPKHGVQHMGGGGMIKKRKGYKHGGIVHEMTNKPVEVPRTTAEGLRRAGIN